MNEKGYSTLEIITTLLFVGITVPALVQLYGYSFLNSAAYEVESKAVALCEQKLEDLTTDKMSPSRGYTWVTTPGRYSAETLAGGYTRTTTVVTAGKTFSGVPYAEVTVSVSHSLIPAVHITTWLTQY